MVLVIYHACHQCRRLYGCVASPPSSLHHHLDNTSFFPAARKSHELLTSNLLESISVGALPAMALGLTATTFSMLVGGGVGVLAALGMGLPPAPNGDYVCWLRR